MKRPLARRWRVRPEEPEAEARLATELGVTPLVARLLRNRGLGSAEAAAAFLDPSLKRLRSPMLFHEMPKAAERLLAAVRAGESIGVYGDYDVDGVTSTTELRLFLRELGREPVLHVPHRLKEGYGLRAEAIQELGSRGVRLLVTADCGAAAHAEIALAQSLGMDVIVCDHHQNPAVRPPAFAVLNPVTRDAGFPFPGLCAAGVVFYLLLGTRMLLRESGESGPDLRRYLDLVALGTVADMVPLVEENRIFVRQGMRFLEHSDRPGLRALLGVSGTDTVTSEALGFRLGPRLNASGRLADARASVDLLSAVDDESARRLALDLDRQNQERRGVEEAMLAEALRMVEELEEAGPRRSLVLASEGWHAGVVGIVASRLVERFFRPVVLLAIEGELARGSARGIPAVHLHEALSHCADLLERFGGHRMAAGLTLRRDRLGDFTARFEEVILAATGESEPVPELAIDSRVDLEEISLDSVDELERLEPFGQGNPRPLFAADCVEVVAARVVGEKHLKLRLRRDGGRKVFDAIAFRKADLLPPQGSRMAVAFALSINRWEGREALQLELVDLQKMPTNPDV